MKRNNVCLMYVMSFSLTQNILDKFNPGAKELISSGKTYLKALHGATAASRLFNDALAKIATNAQQGGTTEIGKNNY